MSDQLTQPVFCYEDVSKRCLGNAELLERVLAAFTSGAESDLNVLKNSILEEDCVLAAKTAHRIKGSASNAAAYQMSAFAAQIERDAKAENTSELNATCVQLLESFESFLDELRATTQNQDQTAPSTSPALAEDPS